MNNIAPPRVSILVGNCLYRTVSPAWWLHTAVETPGGDIMVACVVAETNMLRASLLYITEGVLQAQGLVPGVMTRPRTAVLGFWFLVLPRFRRTAVVAGDRPLGNVASRPKPLHQYNQEVAPPVERTSLAQGFRSLFAKRWVV